MMHSHTVTFLGQIWKRLRVVLILVVMDDALALIKITIMDIKEFSLNPCCNG